MRIIPKSLVLLASLSVSFKTSFAQSFDFASTSPDDWYKRYSAYPPYCSTPEQMEGRGIPPLREDAGTGQTQLVHSTVVIRHGARTPTNANIFQCWEGYGTDPATAVWNCGSKTVMAAPTPIVEDGNRPEQIDPGSMVFVKQFDALDDPANPNLSNVLNGTCELGQLLWQGYWQHRANGKHVREAYLYNSQNMSADDHDARMQLIDIGDDKKTPWDTGNLYFRVDNAQRTMMSGMALLQSMMQEELTAYAQTMQQYPQIPLNTADQERDIVDVNVKACPRLTELTDQFFVSSTFQDYNSTENAKQLTAFKLDVLKPGPDAYMIDCLMNTMCTDRPLPDAINDYTLTGETDATVSGAGRRVLQEAKYGTNLFQRLYDYDVDAVALLFAENNAEYSKLAMGPLWAEIMQNIEAAVNEDDGPICCPERPPSKLALFGAHDTTIMPLLASLGAFDGKWAPYASMMAIEIHKINLDGNKSDHAFRLVYDGKVLTSMVDGCPADSDLCDAQILLKTVKPFATNDRNCSVSEPAPSAAIHTSGASLSKFSTAGGIFLLSLLILG